MARKNKKSIVVFCFLFFLLIRPGIGFVAEKNKIRSMESEKVPNLVENIHDNRLFQTSPLEVLNYTLIKIDSDKDSLTDIFRYQISIVPSIDGNYTFTTFFSSQDPLQINANALRKTTMAISLQSFTKSKVNFTFSAKEIARNALWGNITLGTYVKNYDTDRSWWLLTSAHQIEKESLDYDWNVKIIAVSAVAEKIWNHRKFDNINITLEMEVSNNVRPLSVPIFANLTTPQKSVIYYLKTEKFSPDFPANKILQIDLYSPYLRPIFGQGDNNVGDFRIILGPLALRDEEGEFIAFETKKIMQEFSTKNFDSSTPSFILDAKIKPEYANSTSQIATSISIISQIQIVIPIPYVLETSLEITRSIDEQFSRTDISLELQTNKVINKTTSNTFEYVFSFSLTNADYPEVTSIEVKANIALMLPDSFVVIDQKSVSFFQKVNSTISQISLAYDRLGLANKAVIPVPFFSIVFSFYIIVLVREVKRRDGGKDKNKRQKLKK